MYTLHLMPAYYTLTITVTWDGSSHNFLKIVILVPGLLCTSASVPMFTYHKATFLHKFTNVHYASQVLVHKFVTPIFLLCYMHETLILERPVLTDSHTGIVMLLYGKILLYVNSHHFTLCLPS